MKIAIDRSVLLTSLNHVQSVVERRSTIPILSNIQLDGADGRLSLAATDLDLAINEQVDAEVVDAGATTVPAHMLYDIVRKLPEGSQIELTQAGDEPRVNLRAGRSRFALASLPKDDFPVMATGDLPYRFSLPASDLRRLIDRSRFAISTEETRYYLNGIYLHASEAGGAPTLRAVATDGHRLARVETALPDGADGMPGVIVPRKAVLELRRLIDDGNASVDIALSDTKIRFSFGTTVLTSKLIDGTFPDYERVIPAGNDKIAEVDAKAFAAAVDRVSTISTEKSRAVKLALEKDRLVISATSPELGSATEELPVSYDATDLEIGFNSRYLLDIAGQIDGETARFTLADAGSPSIITDAASDDALYVLMPMRV
jgi:DNA polymerase-3 subunit beta